MGLKQTLVAYSKKPNVVGKGLRFTFRTVGNGWRAAYCKTLAGKPLVNNKIVFISHKGKQYSCNPAYICEYLLEHYPGQFDLVWAFTNPKEFAYLKEKGIRVVEYDSKEHIREMMTAKVIITNVDTFKYLPHVNGQTVLDTWHGGGCYKTCGFMNPQNLNNVRQKMNFDRLYSRITLYCSSSQTFTQQTIRDSRHFYGEVMEVGMPRNDILVNQNRPDISEKVRAQYGIAPDVKIALYAPTFRSLKEAEEFKQLDEAGLKKALTDRFGGEWVVMFRQHHFYDTVQKHALSATDYPDMQELLYTADVLVTDYSSSIWDFSLMFKPVFLYCPDLHKYNSIRSFYMPIEEWPFILCRDQAELERNVRNFDEADYHKDIAHHHELLGSCETGRATELICERLHKECIGK